MFSSESAKHADSCRFCWMCRHICPVAGSTGSESWTPRARGLMISMIERGTEYDDEIAATMYHCTLCDMCAHDCVTGWKPSIFIREARTLAIVNDIAPAAIMQEIENITTKNNIFGLENDEAFAAEAAKHPVGKDTLLFVGQAGRTVAAATAVAAMQLLSKAGVEFSVLADEPASGGYLGDLMGYTGDVQAVAKKAAEAVKASGAKKLIVLNPYDACIFRDQYSQWELLDGVEVVTFTTVLAELIAKGALKPEKVELKASLQEPVKLTRGLEEIAPLKEIVAALGIDHLELYLNGEMSRCVGTVILDGYVPEVTREMVRVRFEDAERLGGNVLLAASPDDLYVLNKHATGEREVVDLFDLINSVC